MFLHAYRPSFGCLREIFLFWSLVQRSFSVSPRFYGLIGRPLACCAPFSSYGPSDSAPSAFPRVSTRLSGWLRAFYLFWSLGQRSFSVSPRFYTLIGRRLAGYVPFPSFGVSVSAPLAFPRISARLSAVLLPVCTHFSSFGRLVSAPLVFFRVSTRLPAVLWLVARLFPL